MLEPLAIPPGQSKEQYNGYKPILKFFDGIYFREWLKRKIFAGFIFANGKYFAIFFREFQKVSLAKVSPIKVSIVFIKKKNAKISIFFYFRAQFSRKML